MLQGAISMSIYSRKNYRKIYEKHYGPIPLDEKGRRYDIHHIDGDHTNNDPSNLKAVTLEEHYDIHFSQKNWGACIAIQMRMDKTSEEISKLVSLSNKERVANGTHHFLGSALNDARVKDGTHPFLGGAIQGETSRRRVKEKTHNLLGGEMQKRTQLEMVANGTHQFLDGSIAKKSNQERVQKGTHHFLGSNINKTRIENGTHQSQVKWKCEHCGKEGKGTTNYRRYHGPNCKLANELSNKL